MAEAKPTSGAFKALLGTIVVALIAGTSSPWWFDRLFSKQTSSASSTLPTQPVEDGPVMGPLEYDKAYLHADIRSAPTASAEDCAALCLSDNRCKAMTYIKSQQLCWIKGEVQGSVMTSDMISAVKRNVP